MIKRSQTMIATSPGETIKELMSVRLIGKSDLAKQMEMTEEQLTSLLDGEINLTEEIARHLEKVLGIGFAFWLNLEQLYRNKLKAIEEGESND